MGETHQTPNVEQLRQNRCASGTSARSARSLPLRCACCCLTCDICEPADAAGQLNVFELDGHALAMDGA